MSLYKRKKTWWIDITHQGRRIRESTGTSDKTEACEIHDNRKAELWKEVQEHQQRTWIDACTSWLNAADRSSTDRYNLRALKYTDRPLSECTPESFEKALENKTPATFNRYRAMIQAILHLAGVSIKIPLRKTTATRVRFLTKQEWRRLEKELPEHLRVMAAFTLATGLRQKNVTHLEWSQVDLRRRVAWIHPDQAKSKRAIGIPLSDDACTLLHGQLGKSEKWVFPYKGRGRKHGGPISEVKTAFSAALKRANVDNFRWHDLRHTWASWHVMNGTPLEVLQKLGGWSSHQMVLRYAHLAPEYLASYAGNAQPYSGHHKTVS